MENREKQLILAIKSGDIKAFEEAVLKYEKAIFRYVQKMTGNPSDSEDITQDSFIKLYRYRENLDPEKQLRALIYKIATNTVYDFLRKKKRQAEISFNEDFHSENIHETIDLAGAYNALEKKGTSFDLNKAMGEIKAEYRTVLLLFYDDGLSYEEIAQTLDTPLNTVKTYMYRAKKALAERMKMETKSEARNPKQNPSALADPRRRKNGENPKF